MIVNLWEQGFVLVKAIPLRLLSLLFSIHLISIRLIYHY